MFSSRLLTSLHEHDGRLIAGSQSGLVVFPNLTQVQQAEFISKENGLVASGITTSVLYAEQHKLIIGFQTGDIQIYNLTDGTFYTISDIRLSPLYTQKKINHLHIYQDKLYVSTQFGLVIYHLKNNLFLVDIPQLQNEKNISIISSTVWNDSIFVAMPSSIYAAKLTEGNLKNPFVWHKKLYVPSATTITSFQSTNQQLFITTGQGIYSVTLNQQVSILPGTEFVSYSGTTDIKQQSFFAFTQNSITEFTEDGNLQQTYYLANPTGALRYQGELFVSSSSVGLQKYSGSEFNSLNDPILHVNNYSGMAISGKEKIFITGRFGTGITFQQNNQSRFFTPQKYPTLSGHDGYYSTVFVKDKRFVSSWGKGIYEIISSDSLTNYSAHNSDLNGISVNADFVVIPDMAVDGFDNLWLINLIPIDDMSLRLKQPTTSWNDLISFPIPVNRPGATYRKIWVDGNGYLWLLLTSANGDPAGLIVYNHKGTYSNLNDDQFVFLTEIAGEGNLPSNTVNDIAFDQNGVAWIATSNGMAAIYNAFFIFSGTTVNASKIFSVENANIRSVVTDVRGNKWLATDNGILLIGAESDKLMASFTMNNSPLLSNVVNKLVYHSQTGELFAFTEFGISVLETNVIQPTKNMVDPIIYPNPFFPEKHQGVWVEGLNKTAEVWILYPDGKVMRKIKSQQSKVLFWDGKDDNGQVPNSGIYFIAFADAQEHTSVIGKIAIIR